MDQYQALGVSRELREAGYALMCVAFPLSDCRMETVEEDEIYELQFGEAFSQWVRVSRCLSTLCHAPLPKHAPIGSVIPSLAHSLTHLHAHYLVCCLPLPEMPQATNPEAPTIERDDFALEIANMDE